MPFYNNYADHEKSVSGDARDRFAALAPIVVREPISTHIAVSRSASGKMLYLIIDRSAEPREGSLVVVSWRGGFRVSRYKAGFPIRLVWGTVVWRLQQE
ncbi:MAG: hypothetical protein LBQ56_06170 [Synergistaceae bacterium]|jgi:hypothetical protein|nr:hypothetical protein [Synergistaceae bacterium]